MKAFLRWMCVAAAVMFGGCVRSLNPLASTEVLLFDPALVGEWSEENSGEAWAFSARDTDKAYDLVYTDGEKHPARFTARLLELGGVRYLSFTPADVPENPNGFYQWHLLATHSFLRVKQIEPTLQMQFPDVDWLKALLRENPTALDHAYVDDELILTASTPDLQAFWARHAGTDAAFEDPSNMTKKPNATR